MLLSNDFTVTFCGEYLSLITNLCSIGICRNRHFIKWVNDRIKSYHCLKECKKTQWKVDRLPIHCSTPVSKVNIYLISKCGH